MISSQLQKNSLLDSFATITPRDALDGIEKLVLIVLQRNSISDRERREKRKGKLRICDRNLIHLFSVILYQRKVAKFVMLNRPKWEFRKKCQMFRNKFVFIMIYYFVVYAWFMQLSCLTSKQCNRCNLTSNFVWLGHPIHVTSIFFWVLICSYSFVNPPLFVRHDSTLRHQRPMYDSRWTFELGYEALCDSRKNVKQRLPANMMERWISRLKENSTPPFWWLWSFCGERERERDESSERWWKLN